MKTSRLWLSRLRSLQILPKVVLTFLLVLSPLYAIGLKMNEYGSTNVKNEIANSLTSRVNLYMDMLDADFDRTIRLLQEYVNDEDLLKLSSSSEIMSDIEKTQAILRLKNRLDLFKNSSQFIENVSAYIPAIDRTVSANANVIAAFDRTEFQALARAVNLFEAPFQLWQNRIFISVSYPDAILNGYRQPLFLLSVEVSRQAMAAKLSQYTNGGGGAVLAGNREHWVVAGSADGTIGDDILSRLGQSDGTGGEEAWTVTIRSEEYMVVQKQSTRLDTRLIMFVPLQNVYKPLQNFQAWLLVLSVASVLIMLVFSYGIYRIIHRPLKALVRAFRKVEQGNFNFALDYSSNDEFGYLYKQFNAMIGRLNVLIHQVYEQQYRVRLAELRHLQSQINPHFLYNTYFILYRMAQLRDHDNVVVFTKHLGDYFQYIARDGMAEVPLEKEASHVKNYMEIQSVRFANRIVSRFDGLPEGCGDMMIPRLILQPILENAYHHGLEQKAKDGWVHVTARKTPEQLVIAVEDNGGSMTEERANELRLMLRSSDDITESTGLVNVHRRLLIKFGEPGGLRLGVGSGQGLRVELIIPLKEEQGLDKNADRG
ncbi:sensor histidine kinase [Paenibacillus hemerocallicola]|uniref:Sensor histidine kinase n=1 Tax=Paenibacillus hemerocallicola TaxID=1172614 RepID=A0A5C4T4M6_9BACL|nr:sensor histidine kinase [Paenibacillus hemerocallicola]TNJ63983.1 sensor histidine kinase [Paenibacillus hemerocallicola]